MFHVSCSISFAISHTKPLTFVTIEMQHFVKFFDLAEDLVEVSLIGGEGDHNKNWEEEEGDDCFP